MKKAYKMTPARGNTRHISLNLTEEEYAAIDEWRRLQVTIPSISEAVRQLLALGVKYPSSSKAKRNA